MADAPATAPKAPKAKAPKSKAPKEKAAKVAPAAPAEPQKVLRKVSKPRHGRLYAKAVFTGYKRGLRNQHENTALLKVSVLFTNHNINFNLGILGYDCSIPLFLLKC